MIGLKIFSSHLVSATVNEQKHECNMMAFELVPDFRARRAAGRAEQIFDDEEFEDSTSTLDKLSLLGPPLFVV